MSNSVVECLLSRGRANAADLLARHAALLSAAALSAAALIAAPTASAQAQTSRGPDLAVQRVTIGQPYVVVKSDGKTTAPISVTVSIRNTGHAAATASVTKISLIQNGHEIAHDEIPLARLAPGHASTQIAFFRHAEPQLGFVHAGITADVNNTVPEPLANDLKLSFQKPVIAQRWTGVMESQVHTPGLFGATEDDDATVTAADFRFSHVDGLKRFAYTVGGQVDQTVTFSDQGCSGSGDGTANMARWGKDSGLLISHDLTRYQAVLRASMGSPFSASYTCPDLPTPVNVKIGFKDLFTETGPVLTPVPMSPTARVLPGHGNLGTMVTITYTWHLVADVP